MSGDETKAVGRSTYCERQGTQEAAFRLGCHTARIRVYLLPWTLICLFRWEAVLQPLPHPFSIENIDREREAERERESERERERKDSRTHR